jgi:hypothetical protein
MQTINTFKQYTDVVESVTPHRNKDKMTVRSVELSYSSTTTTSAASVVLYGLMDTEPSFL